MWIKDPDGKEWKLSFQYEEQEYGGAYDTDKGRYIVGKGAVWASLERTEPYVCVHGVSVCSLEDKFDKRKGRTIALRHLSERLSPEFRKLLWDAVRASGMKLK